VTIEACAELVRRGDPDRFAAVMAAPVAARARLFPLYAWNLEVARAPWVTKEHLIAEMRLQWWRDVVENAASGAARAHEVAGPLHQVIHDCGLPLDVMDRLIVARRADIDTAPFDDQAALDAYLEDTGAGLMWLAARALGANAQAEAAVRDFGWAAGLANYLRAVPDLIARGRTPLVDASTQGIARLARDGRARILQARAQRHTIPKTVHPALLGGWQAMATLTEAVNDPAAVLQGRLGMSEFSRRGRLLWQATTGRW
jgi:15-cis-phytoene synthase